MFPLIMLDVGVSSGIGRAADVARIGFLSGVRADVSDQSALFAEFLIAELTVEGPFVGVDALVDLQFVALVARVAAAAAHEALGSIAAAVVDADVGVEVSFQREGATAQVAQMRFHPAVDLQMDREPRCQHHFTALFALHLHCAEIGK